MLLAISKMTLKSRVKTRLAPLLLTIKWGCYLLIKTATRINRHMQATTSSLTP